MEFHTNCIFADVRRAMERNLPGLCDTSYRVIYRGAELKPDICNSKTLEELAIDHRASLTAVPRPPSVYGKAVNTAGPPPSYDQLELDTNGPAHVLSTGEFFDVLVKLLDAPEPIAADVWSFILKLPTNVKMESAVESLSSTVHETFKPDNLYVLLYQLQIVQTLINQDSTWIAKVTNTADMTSIVELLKVVIYKCRLVVSLIVLPAFNGFIHRFHESVSDTESTETSYILMANNFTP